MIVRVETKNSKQVNFYSGDHVGFHEGQKYKESNAIFFTIIVESRKNSLTLDLDMIKDKGSQIYLMNNAGRVIDKRTI